jgi:amino acid permease
MVIEMMETVDLVMQWLVAPIALVVWYLFNMVNKNNTDVAVLKAQLDSSKVSHDREMKEMKETIKAIFNKLDSIEQSLRDR